MFNRYYSFSVLLLSTFLLFSCSTESTPVYTLSTSVNNTEAGSVSPSSGEFDEGENVEITATPSDDWIFDSWEGDASGNDNPTTVKMDSDKDVAATFVLREYPLTIGIEGEGTVEEKVIQEKSTEYEAGTVVELTAESSDGWRFVRWEGDIEGEENSVTITIDQQKTVTAVFQKVNTESNTFTYNNEEYSLDWGYVIDEGVMGDMDNEGFRSYVFILYENEEDPTELFQGESTSLNSDYIVGFDLESLGFDSFDSGKFMYSDEKIDENYFSHASLAFTEGSSFDESWEDEIEVISGEVEVGISGDTYTLDFDVLLDDNNILTGNITYEFVKGAYPLIVNVEGDGNVAIESNYKGLIEVDDSYTDYFYYGDEIEFEVEASDGWEFIEWQGDLEGNERSSELLIDDYKETTAVFKQGVYDIDGNFYNSIQIGDQTWMVENLRTTKYNNGDVIPNITDLDEWSSLDIGAWVHYSNNQAYDSDYGKLYNWFAVNGNRNICPEGWNVPTYDDWLILIDYLADESGSYDNVGGDLKVTGTEFWNDPNVGATNESGFSALPGGFVSNQFNQIGTLGSWWADEELSDSTAVSIDIFNNDAGIYPFEALQYFGSSVRCVNNGTTTKSIQHNSSIQIEKSKRIFD